MKIKQIIHLIKQFAHFHLLTNICFFFGHLGYTEKRYKFTINPGLCSFLEHIYGVFCCSLSWKTLQQSAL